MKYKLMSAIMAFTMLVSSTIAPFVASKSYASASETEANTSIMEDKNDKKDQLSEEDARADLGEVKIDDKERPESQTNEEQSQVQTNDIENSTDQTDQTDTTDLIEEKEKIINKSVVANLYIDRSYTRLSNKNINVKITGLMPENASIKAYEISNPSIDNQKEDLISIGYEIFDKDNNIYNKNPSDKYKIEIKSDQLKEADQIFFYEKNYDQSSFQESKDFIKTSDLIKLESKADEFVLAKEIEKKEDISKKEAKKDEKSALLADKDAKSDKEKLIDKKESTQAKDILENLTSPIVGKTNFSNENKNLDLINWKKDLLESLVASKENDSSKEQIKDNFSISKNNSKNIEKTEDKDDAQSKNKLQTNITDQSLEENLTYQQVLAEIYTDSSYSQKSNDQTSIKLSGNLPGYMRVKAYPVEIKIEGKEVLAAYDITIFDKDNNEYKVASTNDVKVQITNQKIQKAKDVEVYHKENEQAPEEKVAIDNKTMDTVMFSAESFSIYAVTDPNAPATRTYEFWILDENGKKQQLWDKQTIRNGQSLDKPQVPIFSDRGRYAGWFPINKQQDGSDEIEFFKPINFDTSVKSKTIDVTPKFIETAHIDFIDRKFITPDNIGNMQVPAGYTLKDGYYVNSAGERWYVDNIFKTRTQNMNEPIGRPNVPIIQTEKNQNLSTALENGFSHWSITPDGEPFDIENTPITRDLIAKQSKLSGEEQLTRLDLFAVYKKGHTLTFDTQGGTHVPKQFVVEGDKADMSKIDGPYRAGYKFKYWSLTPDGPEYPINDHVITKTKTLYAIWEPIQTTYKVNHYIENPDDQGYSLYKSETISGVMVGESTQDGDYFKNPSNDDIAKDLKSQQQFKDPEYYGLSDPTDDTKVIHADEEGNGITEINVYYARPRHKLTFYRLKDAGGGGRNYPLETFDNVKYGENTSKYWNIATETMRQRYNRPWIGRQDDPNGKELTSPPQMPNRDFEIFYKQDLGNVLWTLKFREIKPDGSIGFIKDEVFNAIHPDQVNYTGGATLPGYTYSHIDDKFMYDRNRDIGRAKEVYVNGEKTYELIVYYTRNNYDLNFVANNVDYKTQTNSVAYQENINKYVPKNLIVNQTRDKKGSLFKGWYDNPDFTGNPIDFTKYTMPAGEMTFYGKWESNKYRLRIYHQMTTPGETTNKDIYDEYSIDKNSYLSKDDERLTANKPVGLNYDPNKYKVVWYAFHGGQYEPYDFREPIKEDLFLYPVWNYREEGSQNYRPLQTVHTITYEGGQGNGEFVDPNRYLNNADAVVLAPYVDGKYNKGITKPDGKHFQGWLIKGNENAGLHRPGTTISVDRDITFVAQWGEYEYTTLELFDRKPNTNDQSSQKLKLKDNETVKLPIPEGVAGYKFTGWSTKENGGKVYDGGASIMVTDENLPNVLYGNWEKISNVLTIINKTSQDLTTKDNSINYEITYKLEGVEHKEEITIPNNSQKDISIPYGTNSLRIQSLAGQRVKYIYNGSEYDKDSLDVDSVNGDIKVIFETEPLPVPTGIIDNITPMVLMLALAIMGFAFRLYKKSLLKGGLDE